MATPADVLREYLIDLGIIVRQFDPANPPGSDEWSSVTGSLPPGDDYPDQYVALMDMGARAFAPDMRANDTSQHPNVLLNIRALNYLDAFNKAQEVEAALKQVGRSQLDGGQGMIQVSTEDAQDWVIHSIGLATPTTFVGQEEKNTRQVFSVNVRLDCEQVTPANYRSIYQSTSPTSADSLIGYHGGVTMLFPMPSIAGAILPPNAAGLLVNDGTGRLVWSSSAGNTLFVDAVRGNDATGARGNNGLPFLTIGAAQTATVAGDRVVIGPGTFSPTTPLGKNGVTFTLLGSAVTLMNLGVTDQSLIDDAFQARTIRVNGTGTLTLAGLLTEGGSPSVVHVGNAGSDVRVKAERLTLSANDDINTSFAWVINQEAGVCYVEADRLEVTATAFYSAINWINGSLNVRAKEMVTGPNNSGNTGAFAAAVTALPTGDANIDIDHIQSQAAAFNVSGNQAQAKLWIRSNLIEGAAGTFQQTWAGKSYVIAEKIVDNGGAGVGLGPVVISAGLFWQFTQKLTGTYGSGMVLSGGTTRHLVLEIEDLGHLTAGLTVTGGDHTVNNVDITILIGSGVIISGGKLRLRGCKIDTTASVAGWPAVVNGGTLILENCTLLAHAGQDSIHATSAKTVTNYGSVANTNKNINVTVNVQALVVDSNVI